MLSTHRKVKIWAAFLFCQMSLLGCSHPQQQKSAERPDLEDDITQPSCKFARVDANEDPDLLVKEVLAHEMNGRLEDGASWYPTAFTCPGAEVRPEKYAVVTSYKIMQVKASPEVMVYDIAWTGKGGIKYNSETKTWEWDFNQAAPSPIQLKAVKTPFGWRLKWPVLQNGTYLLPEAVEIIAGPGMDFYLKKYGPSRK